MPIIESALVAVEDLQRVYEQQITGPDVERAEALLDVASAKLISRRPSLRLHIAAGLVDADVVRWVLTSSVLRVLRNPQGYSSESVGDLSYRLSQAASSGNLDFTASELADCTPPAVRGARGVGSIRTVVPDYRLPGGGPWR